MIEIEEKCASILAGRKLFQHQMKACGALIAGRDVLLVSPMGSGKSLCYQIPAHLSRSPTLVISPLIALMDDQVEKSRALGLSAGAIHRGIDPEKQWWTIARWMAGTLNVLYTSPERIGDERLRQCLSLNPPGLVVVDEAHCISTWGNRFRPAYRALGQMLMDIGKVPTLAMSATANPAVQNDIAQILNLRNPVSVAVPFTFGNLSINARSVPIFSDRLAHIRELTDQRDNLPMVIFCTTKKQCHLVSSSLAKAEHRILIYHADISTAERTRVSAAFQHSKSSTLVATSAYEMGVDKPDIRLVVHFGFPTSLESYVQGIGRAGRDGAGARSILMYSDNDLDIIDGMANAGASNMDKSGSVVTAAKELYEFASTRNCRVNFLNNHFFPESKGEASKRCGRCDNCHSRYSLSSRSQNQSTVNSPTTTALKEWRRRTAKSRSVPAFSILTDREIERLCAINPSSIFDLENVTGVRGSVVAHFGGEIVAVIKESKTREPATLHYEAEWN